MPPARRTEPGRPRLVEIVYAPDGGFAEPTTLAEALARSREAEETLRAIGAGEVDAFVISDKDGDQRVFTLSTADQLYRMFVENMRDGAATVSSTGLILYANRRLVELLSCPRETIVGSPLSKFMAGGVSEQLRSTGELGTTVEIELVDSAGVAVPVLVGASPLEVDGDRLVCVTFTDLSAKKDLEAQLRQAQKAEAIGSLAGGIAHDFNNLLTVIRGYSAMLIPTLDDLTGREEIDRIDQAAEQAGQLTRQLLAFSRQQILRPEVSDVNAVVAETLTLLERLLGEHILLEQRLDPDLVSILVDRSQLAQVILNLAVNARDAMADGGSLTIQTENCELDDAHAAAHEDVSAGRYVLLQVTDSGVGMDKATCSRVFDPFFTTKEDGTGLGLSTVYGIVKQSGGHVWIDSEPGIGTTLKVYFPATDAPILPPVSPVAVDSLRGTETILVVEDNDGVRVLAACILESYGYHVLTAASGPEALELAGRDSAPRIDLLLTDVVMPLMNGREVADRLTESRPGLRVLFTSGYSSDTIIRHGIAAGRTSFIQKPYLPAELARKLRETLAAKT
jgi:two-component system cell cycle sensor histidine kinase/response regulator CckA